MKQFSIKIVLDMGDYDETSWEEYDTVAEVDRRSRDLYKQGARVAIFQRID